ncbi:kelch repeat-containing protein [Pedobacter aquatilis]|uniref:Kelch repeat-containing protein n=1 Tax=Pedobacter aquatilis TaxID=351343 RepID=UPI00292D2612|nr:kelch repeat-containing protein [Pedobacter aquatilis]
MKNLIISLTYLISTVILSQTKVQAQGWKNISWSIGAKIPAAAGQGASLGLAGAMAGQHNGVFILAGGTNFPDKMPWMGGQKKYYDQVYVFDERLKPVKLSFKLPFNLAYSASVSTASGFIIAGGENEKGLSAKVMQLKWNTDSGLLSISFLPDLPLPTTGATMVAVGDMLYLAGGEFIESSSDRFYSLNLKDISSGWKTLPKLPQPASHSVLLSSEKGNSTKLYLLGGRRKNPDGISTIYDQVYCFDTVTKTWSERAPLPHPLAAASGLQLGDACYVFSGDEGKTFNQTENLISAIKKETDPGKKLSLEKAKATLQSAHPGFSKGVLKYDMVLDHWTELKAAMPYGPVTTNAVLFNNKIIIAAGEIRAGVRTADIVVGKEIKDERK